jgi:hypothetical protein
VSCMHVVAEHEHLSCWVTHSHVHQNAKLHTSHQPEKQGCMLCVHGRGGGRQGGRGVTRPACMSGLSCSPLSDVPPDRRLHAPSGHVRGMLHCSSRACSHASGLLRAAGPYQALRKWGAVRDERPPVKVIRQFPTHVYSISLRPMRESWPRLDHWKRLKAAHLPPCALAARITSTKNPGSVAVANVAGQR